MNIKLIPVGYAFKQEKRGIDRWFAMMRLIYADIIQAKILKIFNTNMSSLRDFDIYNVSAIDMSSLRDFENVKHYNISLQAVGNYTHCD